MKRAMKRTGKGNQLGAAALVVLLLLLAAGALWLAPRALVWLGLARHQARQVALKPGDTYRHAVFTLTWEEMVLSGGKCSAQMQIVPQGTDKNVYLFPRIECRQGERSLPIEIQGNLGDFFNGFFIPPRDREDTDLATFRVSCASFEQDAPGPPPVWIIRLDVLEPQWALEDYFPPQPQTGQAPGAQQYLRPYAEAYQRGVILLANGWSLRDFASLVPMENAPDAPQFGPVLGDQLIASPAFRHTATLVLSSAAPGVQVLEAVKKVAPYGDYALIAQEVASMYWDTDYVFRLSYAAGTANDRLKNGLEPHFTAEVDGVLLRADQMVSLEINLDPADPKALVYSGTLFNPHPGTLPRRIIFHCYTHQKGQLPAYDPGRDFVLDLQKSPAQPT